MKSICRFGQRGPPGAQIQGLFHWNPFFTFHSQQNRTWTPGRLLAPYRSRTLRLRREGEAVRAEAVLLCACEAVRLRLGCTPSMLQGLVATLPVCALMRASSQWLGSCLTGLCYGSSHGSHVLLERLCIAEPLLVLYPFFQLRRHASSTAALQASVLARAMAVMSS